MRVLFIGPEQKKAIAKLVEHASHHVFSLEQMEAMVRDGGPAPGDDPAFSVMLPHGFRCVFSYEHHPGGLCRHLSVSVSGSSYPNPEAVLLLTQEFGFAGDGKNCIGWIEKEYRAVNVIEKVEKGGT